MTNEEQMILHIPEGINFECSGCGNCCFSWPVPLTPADVRRIEEIKSWSGTAQVELATHSAVVLRFEDWRTRKIIPQHTLTL